MSLPTAFVERIKKQLPEKEWADFFKVYDGEPYKGVRVNPLKITPEAFQKIFPYAEERVPWEENGFYVTEKKLGSHVYHFAGLFYSQEPSAMCAAPLLEVRSGERVLDLCSAPGGKGTRLAADLCGKGLIVLNEPIVNRAKILSQNVERMGIENAVVTAEYPEKLATFFPEYFDKIMVDAPCSGEGMFRKNAEEALSEWSEENVARCAERQAGILSCAVKMLAVGGKLVYSTCTFSEEEDEKQVERFLQEHPEMRLMKIEKLYPHKVKGEGHFAALFEKVDGGRYGLKEKKSSLSKVAEAAYRAFERECLFVFKERLYEAGGVLYALPEGVFDWTGLNILRVGVRLGEVKNGRFEPSHSLAMASKKEDWKNVAELTGEGQVDAFLRGESVFSEGKKGWCLVLADGYPIGLGKRVDGTLKNHLPKGLRKV
ncbi:MAG: RsmF rRNA methyltransferase first C-terminal domain-containing protein [Clostridia bacterium]|nr:RsmF rRNA methyltransferase first C-terminal domain-containing protein [Clostridia bacterium]